MKTEGACALPAFSPSSRVNHQAYTTTSSKQFGLSPRDLNQGLTLFAPFAAPYINGHFLFFTFRLPLLESTLSGAQITVGLRTGVRDTCLKTTAGQWWHAPLIPALERERLVNF